VPRDKVFDISHMFDLLCQGAVIVLKLNKKILHMVNLCCQISIIGSRMLDITVAHEFHLD
jgi:hypothetical protein